MTMYQVELLEAKTETFGPMSAGPDGSAMKFGHISDAAKAFFWPAGLRGGSAPPGDHGRRSSFYAMTFASTPSIARRQSVGDRSPRSRTRRCWLAIEADLEASPWEGEGYRKVWARLRVCRDIRVARKRVLRLMRENNLLSPHRCRRRGGNPHDGEIITHAPNLACGAPMAFGCSRWTTALGLDLHRRRRHWNAECVGWHVCKRGDRFGRPAADLHLALYGWRPAAARKGSSRNRPPGPVLP